MTIRSRFASKYTRFVLVVALALSLTGLQPSQAQQFKTTADMDAALARISADSLRGNLSFIASDALEGRNTPSRGLDIAAEYIAAQFRRAGLEPVGDDGYFQTANWFVTDRDADSFDMRFEDGDHAVNVAPNQVTITTSDAAMKLSRAQLFKVDLNDSSSVAALTADQIQGKVILTALPDIQSADRSRRQELMRGQNDFLSTMSSLKAAMIISIDRTSPTGGGIGTNRLIDPENRQGGGRPGNNAPSLLTITVHNPKVVQLFDSMKTGSSNATMTLDLPASYERPVKIRNVIGVLRGSDPVLKDTYVLVTAHYDHLGMRPFGEGDRIYNGANDDGSGTVSVMELASALSTLKQRPKRSIVFMTVFGEEKGLRGSRYYGRHPIFPIEKTVADVNLEQVGRTDSTEGPQINNASMTGFDFTDVGTIFQEAGKMTGINVYKHDRNSDAYFGRSDNQALADQGVPAHTICVAFDYPDYHGVGDHWDKVDCANMAKVDRMVGLGLLMIANNPIAPKWNTANPKTERYVKAWNDHHESK
ncbi:MAG TPA: M28 family peptidase [Blastocatellia bacterium]|nr:M28 family peptidase [Blastocatellia bacterium]